jgi:hypothetical protein
MPLTWTDWRAALESAGFRVLEERRLGPGSPGGMTRGTLAQATLACVRRPSLLADLARFRRASRRLRLPRGWVESWACCAIAD